MSNYPIGRLRFYDKNEKRDYDVAAVFESKNEKVRSWKRDIAPEKRPDASKQYPSMLLSEAAARAERGEGYLSYCVAKKRDGGQPKSGGDYPPGDFGDDDIPF